MPKKGSFSSAFNPAHKGEFTKKAKKAGMGVQAFAAKELAPGSKASPKTKKQAALAKAAQTVANRHKKGK